MIANTSSGKRFGPLADYLVAGRSGTETDRVAWTAGRNLGTDDPTIAAPLMQATARQSTLVQAPVYHLTISFDHQDQVTPQQMQAVADRVLRDLGLAEHQALMVAHRDREHAHVHIMVNRVHPDTGVARERWQDRPKIERALREEERALGLRQVTGRLHEIQSTDISRRGVFADSRRRPERMCNPAFVEGVRSALPELRAARSREDLAARLSEHGLRVEGKGQGLVFTDGAQEVKASRVGRDLSLRRLEERFGTPYPAREQFTGAPVRAHAELTPATAEVAASAREIERVSALHQARYRIEQELSALQGKREHLEHAISGATSAARAFDRSLSYVYREPESAREAIRDATSGLSVNDLAELIRSEPERFGALRTLEERRAFGLFNIDDDAKARASATIVARDWNTLATREQEAITLSTDYARAVEHRFARSLAVVYRNPIPAREAFELARAHAGVNEAIRTLAQSPDRLGALRAPGTAPEVARLDWATLAERARDALAAPPIRSAELAKAAPRAEHPRPESAPRRAAYSLAQAPDRELLTRTLHRAVGRLEPAELTQLRGVLTSPQAAIVFKAQQTARDIVLGRDGHER